MVMSTLHTNDAISTAIRLIDMGAEGYLIASALKAVLAQRLVRKVCESCVTDHPLDATEQAWVKSIGDRDYSNATFKQGTGCPQCNNTGYHGRVGVYELLYIDTELGDALRSDDALLFARRARQQKGFRTLSQLALDYASQGITTVEEVIRISGDIEEFDNSDLQQATATSSPPAIDET
jgi:MSHA biogenesis protein MshE